MKIKLSFAKSKCYELLTLAWFASLIYFDLVYCSRSQKNQQGLFYIADEDKWKTEARTEGGAIQEYTISYQNLVPSTSYTFRVIAYNKYGISYPAKSQASVRIINHLFLARFSLNRKLWAKIAQK